MARTAYSPHDVFSVAMRRIKTRNCWGIGGRPGRDFRRQNSFQPARCQRIIFSGHTITRAPRQSNNRDNIAREILVTGSIRRGLIRRS
jgi:hypothetical protein